MLTELPPIPISTRDFRLNWESDAPSGTIFKVYRDGDFLGSTENKFFDVFVDAGDRFVFEIREDDDPPAYNIPTRASLWWQGSPLASTYIVERWVDPSWVEFAKVVEDGSPTYKIRTEPLANLTEHRFRITIVDVYGNESPNPFELKIITVYRPDSPSWEGSYDSGTGNLTITIT